MHHAIRPPCAKTTARGALATRVLAAFLATTLATHAAAAQEAPPLGERLRGVQHFGITVHDLGRAHIFYTQVLGGTEVLRDGDFQGAPIQNTLMQVDELRAAQRGVNPRSVGVPDMRGGAQRLDVVFIQFDNVVIELLQYRDAAQRPFTGGSFAPAPQATSPAFPTNMHVSFQVADNVDFNRFIRDLESEAARRGMTNVACNRVVDVASEAARRASPLESSTNAITSGPSDGWALAYCKGPEGEQLEFNQVLGPVKARFDAARAQRARRPR